MDGFDGKELYKIFEVLRNTTGVDFAYYKQNTIKRRIQRRLSLHKLSSLEEYFKYLTKHPDEADELYADLLINVTNFFRDSQVFHMLKTKIFPEIIAHKAPEETIRMWVPGCSTGEEVYSIAICLLEFLKDHNKEFPIQIFGTDISETAIDKARTGIYKATIEKDVSKDRLDCFFTPINNHYQINKSIRDICIFAKQNLVGDPPFSNLDLISCRNLLIYLEPILQKRIIPTFHYALRPHGHLMLGNSETIGEFIGLFQSEDKKNKIYSKKVTPYKQHFQLFGNGPIKPREKMKIQDQKLKKTPLVEEMNTLVNIQQEVDKIILSKYAPDGVVINNNLDIIQFKGHTSLYLEPAPGKASLNLLKMAREGLFLALNSAIRKAQLERVSVRKEHIQFEQNGKTSVATIEVIPIKGTVGTEATFLVLFEASEEQKKHTSSLQKETATDDNHLTHLKQELTATREYLQSTIQELELTNEELQSANEEILSNNEELQSVNEELETSKEELQSANEELTTLNEELENRNLEINQINNDLNNLLSSVNIPIIMLDTELCIRRFTPGSEKVMNLIPSDIGRPIGNIRPNILIQDLEAFLFDAVHRNMTKELEIQDKQGKWYLLRVTPYKTREKKTEGAIMIFIDIDALKKSEIEMAKIAAIVDSSDDAIISHDVNGIITSWNKAAERLYGYTEEEMLGKPTATLIPSNKKDDFPNMLEQLHAGKKIKHYETQRMTKDGRILEVSLTVSPIKDTRGTIIGASKIARDITQKKHAEENLQFLAKASELLSSSLDYKTTLANITKLAVPTMADWCTVDMLNDDGELELVNVAHKDPEKVMWARELRKVNPIDINAPTGVPNVMRTKTSDFYPIITDDMLVQAAKNEKELTLLRKLEFASAMTVPLIVAGEGIGGISFITTENKRHYTKDDLAFAEELAKRAALAIQNARLYNEAKNAIELRDEFISVASHELKTPITSLKMYMKVLEKQMGETTQDTGLPLESMNAQLTKLTLLINDLLSVSRLQHGKMEFSMESFDINHVIEETIESVQEMMRKHKIIVHGKLEQAVYGDKYRISQVLTNLFTNAIKYSPHEKEIQVKITSDKTVAKISVHDFGIGINKKHQEKIFDQFYRVTSFEERTYPGLGMGLYISNEIIKRHGGTMSVESEKGKGSTFTFTIPYKK